MGLAEVKEKRAQRRRLRKLERRHELQQQKHRERYEQEEAVQGKQEQPQSSAEDAPEMSLTERVGHRRYTAAQMIEAIRTSKGLKSRAARRLGCDWATVDKYCKDFPAVQEAYHETREKLLDLAESKFRKKIAQGFWPAIRFGLATIGKHRGYTERIEQVLISRSDQLREFESDLDRAYNQGSEGDGDNQTSLPMQRD